MMDDSVRTIIDQRHLEFILDRLAHQLVEEYDHVDSLCLIGIQPRGIFVLERLRTYIENVPHKFNKHYGQLDITFYRDDFRRRNKPLSASQTRIDFLVEDRHVVLIDDVLYTGRTVQAALTALSHYGRAKTIRLLSLIDRRFNREVPIKSDFTGLRVDAVDEAYIAVKWKELEGENRVVLFSQKQKPEND